MHALSLRAGESVERVLAIGCHSDDIEIGCGGTIVTLLERNPDLEVTWLVLSAEGPRADEAKASAAVFLAGARREPRILLESFRDGYFPYVGGEVKDAFERLKPVVTPQIIFTHAGTDLHQDHRLVAELTWNTFRNHLVVEYEIAKYEGDLGSPNLYVPLSRTVAARKIELLLEHFASQRSRPWFRSETFDGLMCLRGVECNAPEGRAEAFHAPKMIL